MHTGAHKYLQGYKTGMLSPINIKNSYIVYNTM